MRILDFLAGWINGIIIAIIINTIIELIIPEGKNKKYIRTIMGIYISFVIISPIIIKIKDTDINLNDLIQDYEVEDYSIQTSIDANKYIEDTYITKIKQDIEEKLLQKKYEVISSDITIENEDENSYGELLKISLKINKIENNNDKVEIVKKVNINSNDEEEKIEISEEEKEELKEYLQSVYGTDKEDIEVYV